MRVRDDFETIASYSRWKSAGLALVVLAVATSILARPVPTAAQLLAERYGWLWPGAALISMLVAPLTTWLAVYVLLFGGAAISRKGDRFVIYRPWPKAVPINSIKYIEASHDAEDIPSPLGNSSLIPQRYKVVVTPRVRIFLKDQSSVTISTGLMEPGCAAIAAAMSAVLRRE
jgi:hypothetical protein